VRISGGAARGVTLVVPPGDDVRPATDGLRQAVFSSLGARAVGARFFDLFAGSGAYGLEALSRGAIGGVFVEKNAKAAACIQKNLEAVAKSLGKSSSELARVSQTDVLTWSVPAGWACAELIFIDPPYDRIATLAPKLLARATEWVDRALDPLILFETPGELAIAHPDWEPIRRIGGKNAHQPGISVFRMRVTSA